jgi:hypothetical protein
LSALPERVRVLLFLTVALPLAAALVSATLRYGGEFRAAAERRAVAVGDSLVDSGAFRQPRSLLAAAATRGYDVALYRSAGGAFRKRAAQPARFGDTALDARTAALLRRGDPTQAIRPQGGRTAVIVPLPPAANAVTDALLLVDREPVPTSLPALPLLLGLAVLITTLHASAAFARRATAVRAVLALLPAIAFCALLMLAFPVAPGGGAYRAWTAGVLAAWLVLAVMGFIRVRAAVRHGSNDGESSPGRAALP